MKKYAILLALSLLFASCGKGKEVDSSRLQERNGTVYEVNQKKGFTGIAVTKSRHGNVRRIPYKNGKIEGTAEYYFDNGQLEKAITYKDGKKEGFSLTYVGNGQLVEKYLYKNDKLIEQVSLDVQTGKIKKKEIIEDFLVKSSAEKELIFKKITLKYNDEEKIVKISVGSGNLPIPNYPHIRGLDPIESNNYRRDTIEASINLSQASDNYLGYEYIDGGWIAYLKCEDEYPVSGYKNGEEIVEIYNYVTMRKDVKDNVINVKDREKIIESLKKITKDEFWID